MFRARPDHGSAVLLLEPQARWIAEYYPVEEVVELPPDDVGHDRAGHGSAGDGGGSGGRARVLLRYADPAWLVRLVLGLGGGARVLAPPELAAEVARRARASLARAGGGPDGVQGAEDGVQGTDGGDGTRGGTARRTEAGGT